MIFFAADLLNIHLFLITAINTYRANRKKGLTPDEERSLFFELFDIVYKTFLPEILDSEMERFAEHISTKMYQMGGDNKAEWHVWDTRCGSLLGF